METLAACLNNSPARCCAPPFPAEAYDRLPGLARAWRSNSLAFWNGEWAGTTSSSGARVSSETGAKSAMPP